MKLTKDGDRHMIHTTAATTTAKVARQLRHIIHRVLIHRVVQWVWIVIPQQPSVQPPVQQRRWVSKIIQIMMKRVCQLTPPPVVGKLQMPQICELPPPEFKEFKEVVA